MTSLQEDTHMKHVITISAAALLAVCVGCNRPGGDRNAANTVTVTGCVQAAEQGLASPSADSKPDKFILTNANVAGGGAVAPAADAAPKRDAPSDAAPAPEAAASGAMYMLDGKTDELRAHLNQQVEITGKIDANTLRDPSTSSPEPRQELNVDSVRMVAATCSR
jgi:hypothetical protein